MVTKIIKFNNGTDTYAPVTLASAVQYNTGGNTPMSVQDAIGTVAQSLIDVANNANGSYMSVSGATDPTVKILTPNGTSKSSYQFKGSGAGNGSSTGHVTVSYANGIITFGTTYTDTVPNYSNTYAPKTHVDSKATTTAYGHVKVDDSINATSTNPVQNKAINTALGGKAASNHTHTLNWTTSAKTTDAGTEIDALVAVPSSTTSLGQSGATATFTTYTLPTKKYVDSKIGEIGSALNFKGTVGPSETQTALPTSGVKVGDVWLVKLASGTNSTILSGQTLENGDMIIATNSSPVAWTVVNANWTAKDGDSNVTVGASTPTTLATIGGVAIDIKVVQEANVVHKSDLTSYVNRLNSTAGTGVVTGAKLETNGGGQKLTLTYTDNSSNFSNSNRLYTITNITQNSQGKITSVVTTEIPTMKSATASAAGTKGFVPDPPAGSQNMVLTGDAKFKIISASQDAHATGLLYKTMNTTEEFTLFDDKSFTGSPVSLATIASPAITVSLCPVFYGEVVNASQPLPTISLNGTTNTPSLDTLTNMFYLDSWSNAAPTSMSFGNKSNIKSITKLKGLDTSKVTDMNNMFNNCSSLTSLDLSNFNTSSVKTMGWMFQYCSSLTSLDLSSFNTSNVTNMSTMFYECSSLTSLDLSSFNTSNVTNIYNMFNGCSALTSLNLSNWDTSNVKYYDYMFIRCSSLKDVYITVEATLNKLTNNLTSQGSKYIPSSATIHYNNVDYKWQNNAWKSQS